LIEIINLLENRTNLRTNQVQADWGGEFRNTELAIELKQRGTSLKETVPYHSETNAIAERMNRTILDMNRTAIAASGMPKGEWGKVSKHSAYTKNRVPHKSLEGKTPVEVIFGKDARMERQNLRPFGQKVTCYDYETTDKLSSRSYEGQIVGYTETHGTYWIKDQTGKSRLAKSPKPIDQTFSKDSSSDEEEEPTSENPLDTEPTPQAAPDIILAEIPTPETSAKAPKKKRIRKDDDY